MKTLTALAVLAAVGGASVCAAGDGKHELELTPLPGLSGSTTWALAPRMINANGDLAGQASVGQYHAARWTKGGGIEDLHPAPNLLVSWAKAINDSGVVIGDACLPPPGGNGPCGMYFFRNTPGVGSEQLHFEQSGVTHTTSIYPMFVASDGGIAMSPRRDVMQGGGEHVVYYRDDVGWMDLSSIVSNDLPRRARLIDMNRAGQVLMSRSWEGNVVRWSLDGGAEVILDGTTVFATDMNDSGQFTGVAIFASGSGAFMYDDAGGLVQLDPEGAFPDSQGVAISNSGVVAGLYSDGAFVYTPGEGIRDIGVDRFTLISGLNVQGDLLLKEHNPQTYEVTVKLMMAGGEPVSVQELIDPAQSFIIVSDVSDLNDSREFAVLGADPTGQNPVAFLAKIRCKADYDGDGVATVSDIFAFLSEWFAGQDRANVNRDGSLNVADIFEFLSVWFAGC